jgi:integrase
MSIQEVFQKRKLAPSTIKAYTSNYNQLEKRAKEAGFDTGKKKFGWLKDDPDKLIDAVSTLGPLTQRNYMNLIIGIAQFYGYPFAEYESERDKYNKGYWKQMRSGEKTEKQKQNWAEKEDLLEILDQYTAKFNRIARSSTPLTNKSLKILNEAILVIYYITPFTLGKISKQQYGISRNDLADLVVAHNRKETNDKSYNYLLIMKSKTELIFNQFKTEKSIGQVSFELPKQVSKFFRQYLTLTSDIERLEGDYFLVASLTGQFFSKKMITSYLNRVFKRELDVKISTTALRHIFLSENFGKEKEARDNLSEKMMHSTSVQNNVYIKKM